MSNDITAKLQSLKSLRGQMKDWKKDDLRKKKGLPEPKQTEQHEKSESNGQPQSMLAKLIEKLVTK